MSQLFLYMLVHRCDLIGLVESCYCGVDTGMKLLGMCVRDDQVSMLMIFAVMLGYLSSSERKA